MRNFFKQLKKDERGLTLVELLAVIVILAIVGAIAVVAIGNVMENSRQDAHIANAQQVISSAQLYEAGGGEIGTEHDAQVLITDGYLDTLIDPWDEGNDDYNFTLSKEDNTIQVNHSGSDCNFDGPKSKEDLSRDGRNLCD